MKLLSLTALAFFLTYVSVAPASEEKNNPEEATSITSSAPYAVEESEIAFHKMMDVLTHQRCVNCHPAGDAPLQGDDQHTHYFGVLRGEDNHGTAALKCQSCHQAQNNTISGAPGAPEWSLAPRSMAWEGKTRFEIAASMMDRATNGNRSADDIMHHLTEHELVLWAWEPGVDADGSPREAPPVPKEEYIEAVKTWIAAGAVIPNE